VPPFARPARLATVWLAVANAALSTFGQNSDAPLAPAAVSPFKLEFDRGAIVSLRRADGRESVEYITRERRLGDVVLRFRRSNGNWQTVETAVLADDGGGKFQVADDNRCVAEYEIAPAALKLTVRLACQEGVLNWTIELANEGEEPLEIGDLAVPLPISSPFSRDRRSPAGPMLMKHGFISGHGSFVFWARSDGIGPNLVLMPIGDTHLEFWDTGFRQPLGASTASDASVGSVANRAGRVFHVYVHSAAAGAVAKSQGCNWRQPNTSCTLAARGQPGDSERFGFRFRWASDQDAIRQLLVDEGLIDVHVVPGMTVPADLFAQVALRTRQKIHDIEAEHAASTEIGPLETRGEYQLVKVRFRKLGENRLSVRYGDDRRTFLEFFVTEPLETLIKKRGAFIARCQHRDPSKWYNGLLAEWNMESQVLLGPDNYDRISGFRIYAVTCDDPGLSKPAFLAAKNAEFPVQSEVAALDYYIKNFVWGGLQMTTGESHPYAIYGIQDWKRNRDSDDPGRNGRLHIWRCYDYPHIILMYFNMYRVAKNHPQIPTALTADEYLQRAYGTAKALFTVPYEVERWSAYHTGFYNELVIVDLIAELEAAGKSAEADELRDHWRRKVEFFVSGRPDLFRSEYPFDSTGFESTHALAKYAVQHPADEKNGADRETGLRDAQRFMEKQLAANIFCRGWLEPTYYHLGSDYRGSGGSSYTLTYMSQMGGWSVLDYAIHFAADPNAYLRLGYASYLSAWALMNTGTAESNYGCWYPGKANDGGAGGGFEPAPFGYTWLGQPHHRGSWYYACEIDLGFCGGLRAARTVLADDPIFGRFCFGGDWRATSDGIEVTPKDGVRRRFHALLGGRRLHLELDSDRFSAAAPIKLHDDLSHISFVVESDNQAKHTARLGLGGLQAGQYVLDSGNEQLAALDVEYDDVKLGRMVHVEVPVEQGGRSQPITIRRAETPSVNTFSIVAIDPKTGDLGIAVASKVLGVGSIVPYAKAGVGAIATQSAANTAYGPEGLAMLASGKSAKETVRVLTEADEHRDVRQLGIADAAGNVAAFSGAKCNGWFGHVEGDHYSVQGNLLAGEEVLKQMAAAFEKARDKSDSELADWLMAALKAGDEAGGDKRGKQSASLVVARDKAGYGGNDRYIDLRVEDHQEPVAELDRLLNVHKEYFDWPHRNPPRREKSESDDGDNEN
jgi:uncharacterized Ntn-hydrolase superfamily protein